MSEKQENTQFSTSKKTIFLFLGNRLHIMDALRTRFIGELSERHRVIIFLPTDIGGEKPDISTYPKGNNISYHFIPAPIGKFWILFHELRSELITRFNDAVIVKLKNKKRKNFRSRMLRFVARFLPKVLFSPEFFTKIESVFVPEYAHFDAFAKKYNPDIVLLASPCISPLESYAVLWARRGKIPSVGYNPSWDNLVVYPRHIRRPDYLIVWNEQNRQAAIDWHGYPSDRVFLGGVLRFDHYFRDDELPLSKEEFLISKGLDPKRKTVLFAAALHGTFYRDFIRAFISWQKSNKFDEQVNLFVRVHTLDSLTAYQEFLGMPGIHIERAGTKKQSDKKSGHKAEMDESDLVNNKMTLKYCDLCATLTSTMSVEAMIFDKPIVCAGFIPGYSEALTCESYGPLVECGASRVAPTLDEMGDIIKKYLQNPSEDRQNRECGVEYAMGPTDGYSYKRVSGFIDEILERRR